jgi:nicotinate-nucleotide adenylyltransferase
VVAGTVGVFGGTFDPIHYAHLALAEEAAQALGLEQVLFVPAGRPPHKPDKDISPGDDRLAMVELAIAGNSRFAVDRQELDRDGPSYTLDTLLALRSRGGGGVGPGVRSPGQAPELTLILSSEAFADLPGWHEPRRILELARIAVGPREGYPDADARAVLDQQFPDLAGRVVFLDSPRMQVSASELRERAAAGRSLRYLVPDAVAAYIDDHALYRNLRRNQPS